MKTGPSIAALAALVGDPARANMLTALLSGSALTASELAAEAGVGLPTASSHLAKLAAGSLLAVEKQGRHRYFRLSGADVAALLEGLMGLAARTGQLRTRPGPKDPALRHARVCYDHLAGELGVALFDSLARRRLLELGAGELRLTRKGAGFVAAFGIELAALGQRHRPLCRSCLDWSARRSHLAGALGAALLARIYELKWARREPGTRILRFSPHGEAQFRRLLAA
jgi:DNA-binding transcriptional ArsR family regulator